MPVWLYFELLSDGRACHPVSKGEPSHPAEKAHFNHGIEEKAYDTRGVVQNSTFPNRAGVKRIAGGWILSVMECCWLQMLKGNLRAGVQRESAVQCLRPPH